MGKKEAERRETDAPGTDVLVAIALEEELADTASGRHGAAHRVRQAAGDGQVRPEVVGRGVQLDSFARRAQASFFTSARSFAGSGNSPRP